MVSRLQRYRPGRRRPSGRAGFTVHPGRSGQTVAERLPGAVTEPVAACYPALDGQAPGGGRLTGLGE